MQLASTLRLLRWLSRPGSNLSQRALHATLWTLGAKGFEHILNYIRIVVLARLLDPVDFGVMGIGLVAVAALETITLPGFQEALVQRKGNVEGHLDTLWTLTVIRILVVSGILALAAPFLATFFKSPDATLVLQVLAGAELLRALVNPGILYFQRDLEFHKKSINDVGPTVAEMVAAVTAAVILQSVWALVFGFLARRAMQVLVSYWSHPYRPRLTVRREAAKDLFSFGRWVYLNRLVTFISVQSDSIILARLLGPVTLGFYQMAQRAAVVPLLEIHRSISAVAFPLYSKVQDDPQRLKKGFLRGVETVSSLSFPLAVTLFILAPEFVAVVLGEKWLAAIPVIKVLAIAAALHSVAAASGGSLFMGTGRPWLAFQMNALRATAIVATVFPLTMFFGLVGAAYAVLIAGALSFGFHIYHSFPILSLRVTEYLKALCPALIVVAAIAFLLSGAKHFAGPVGLTGFVMLLGLVAVIYGGVFLLLSWKFKMGLLTNVRQMVGK